MKDESEQSDLLNKSQKFPRPADSDFDAKESFTKSPNDNIIGNSKSADSCPYSNYQYVCPFCLEQFRHQEALTSHEFFHTGQANLPFKCLVCEKGFRKSKLLILHSVLHENFHVSDF